MTKWFTQIRDLISGVVDELYRSIGFAASSNTVQFFKATSVNIFVSVFLPVAEVIVAEVDDLMLTNAKKRREAFNRITKAVYKNSINTRDKAKLQWKPHLVNLLIEMAVSELKSRRLDG